MADPWCHKIRARPKCRNCRTDQWIRISIQVNSMPFNSRHAILPRATGIEVETKRPTGRSPVGRMSSFTRFAALPLGELERLAGALAAVFLALLHAPVAGQEPGV